MAYPAGKKCVGCERTLPRSNYGTNTRNADGKQLRCFDCYNAKVRERKKLAKSDPIRVAGFPSSPPLTDNLPAQVRENLHTKAVYTVTPSPAVGVEWDEVLKRLLDRLDLAEARAIEAEHQLETLSNRLSEQEQLYEMLSQENDELRAATPAPSQHVVSVETEERLRQYDLLGT